MRLTIDLELQNREELAWVEPLLEQLAELQVRTRLTHKTEAFLDFIQHKTPTFPSLTLPNRDERNER